MERLQEEPNSSMTKEYKCQKCDKKFDSQKALKEHRKLNHNQSINCKYCDENFNEKWKLELHMKNHADAKLFKCDHCSKEFPLEWRLGKHLEIHMKKGGRKCNYFNNFKICPYEVVGCKFIHEASEKCFFADKCANK